MAIYEDPPPGAPEWAVTYGDMMSLILTFFIMLVAMSELKKNDKFQGVADALEQQFGPGKSADASGDQPRRAVVADAIERGRVRREQALRGDAWQIDNSRSGLGGNAAASRSTWQWK